MLRFEKASLLHDKPRLHFLALGKKVCIVNACGTRASRAILRHTNKGDCSEDVDSPRHPAQDVAEANFLLAALLFSFVILLMNAAETSRLSCLLFSHEGLGQKNGQSLERL